MFARAPNQPSGLNCSNFASPAAAQRYFLLAGGPTRDVDGLDRDGDGFACEFGNVIRQNSLRFSANSSKRKTHAEVEPSGCYVGPRGGTYTITASGRKNYGGC
ncbi:excalibur calcium-binding domain-containing protein [Agrobacterium vitis]